jgi:multiple sugar transport system substrate-binding protein
MLQSPDTAPDLVLEDTFFLPTDAAAGYLLPLDDQLAKYPDWTNGSYYEALKAGVTGGDGKIYGIPFSTDSRGLWYNKELLEQAGFSRDWAPKTWQDILDACAALKKIDGVVPFWCNSGVTTGEATSMQTYEMLLYGTGERLLDSKGKWIVSSPGILDSLKFIEAIYSNGYGPPLSLVLNAQSDVNASQQYMSKGKLGIFLNGFWLARNFRDVGIAPWEGFELKLDFAAMPTSKGQVPGSITLAGGWGLAIPKHSKAPDLAFDFAMHMMKPEIYGPAMMAMGDLATRTDVAKMPAYGESPFIAIATEFLAEAAFRPQDAQYPVVSSHIQTMVEAVVTGTSPEDAMEQFAADVTAVVGEDKVVTLK